MDSVDPLGPSAEFVSVHRRRLITTILKALRRHEEADGHGPGMYKFPLATWFSLWLSDMDRLEEIAAAFERNPILALGLYTESCRLVTLWVPHFGITPRPTSAVASPTAYSTLTINRTTQLTLGAQGTQCLDRDRVCDVTKSTNPSEAAHICPVSLIKHRREFTDKYNHFQNSLAVFWPEAQV